MRLLKTSIPNLFIIRTANKNNAGFTLLELLIVIGLISFLAVMGLLLSMDSYRSYSFNYEERLLISILQRARSQAMANLDQDQHCAWVQGSNYVISKGSACTGGDVFQRAAAIDVNWTAPLVFNQLDGSVTVPMTITLTGQGKTANITINNEGQIDW